MRENDHEKSDGGFVAFPLNNLVAVFHSADAMRTAISELKEMGLSREDVQAFSGEQGMQDLDFDGSANGPIAQLLRSLQNVGPDRIYLQRYEQYMQDGDSILMVRAPQEERKQTAAGILRKHSAHRVTYFGTLVIEEV